MPASKTRSAPTRRSANRCKQNQTLYFFDWFLFYSAGQEDTPTDLLKTLTDLVIGYSVAYALTESLAIAGGIALIEPLANSVAFFCHEKVWNRRLHLFGAQRLRGRCLS